MGFAAARVDAECDDLRDGGHQVQGDARAQYGGQRFGRIVRITQIMRVGVADVADDPPYARPSPCLPTPWPHGA